MGAEWNDREPYLNQWSSETAWAQRYENGTSGKFEHGPMLALVRSVMFLVIRSSLVRRSRRSLRNFSSPGPYPSRPIGPGP